MMLIFGLMLLQTAACLDQFCSFDQSDPCYTALGHKLNLMMVQDASKYDLKIHKRIYNPQDDPLCRVKYGRMRECDLYNNRPEVTVINGTVIINRVNRTDSGIYTLTLTHSGGLETSRDLQVIVEGLDRFCWFDQPDPCYAALGHKLNLPMVLDDSVYDLKLKRIRNINTQDGPDCRIKCGSKKKCDLYNNRPEVTVINGTLIINRVIRADSGNYTLALTHQEWGVDPSKHLQVIVEAPTGSVEVSIICSSSGVMRVFCSSEGDQLLYSWTLNGDPLMDGNSSIDLDEETDGDISCSVKNHVSHTQKTIRLKPCPVSVVFVVVWCLQLMFLFGLLGAFHIYMRHTSGKKPEDQKVRMRRFREGHEHTAEDS
ncbi:uncharacterized protein LOC132109364 isoform X1 [Carassius carassius]|uniref:uncharacterized protein LOC132109364 isoform X1 n=1 Tax=Carassius carassius TaxID=217509 RepID=UPI0028697D61|nr:uncharacterized protein LOC132109364 isoform X1 [Carassius carassius]